MIVYKLKLKLKWALNDILSFFGYKTNYQKHKGEVRTLCFHGVCSDNLEYINGRFLSKFNFEHLLFKLKEEFNIISLTQFIKEDFSQDQLNVLLTFDDGYKALETYVFPTIIKEEIPITVFMNNPDNKFNVMDLLDVAKADNMSLSKLHAELPQLKGLSITEIKEKLIDSKKELVLKASEILIEIISKKGIVNQEFYELLSNDDLKEYVGSGLISLGNHTSNHLNAKSLSNVEFNDELESLSKAYSNYDCYYENVMAYPYGHYSKEVSEYIASKGFSFQFTTDIGVHSNACLKDRLTINPFISLNNQLKSISDGKY